MNIRDLQYLVSVYELGSFSKAAEACFVSQPTLSGQLKKLEQELGAPLMERSTRKVLFTKLGESIVEDARSVLKTVEKIRYQAKQTEDPMAGDFHIGLIPTIGPYLLPKIMPTLKERYPQMNVFLYELKTEVLIEKLLNGDLDAGVLAKLDWDYPVQEQHLYSEELLLATQSQDPLAKEDSDVGRSILKERTILMLEDGHCLRDQALGVCFAEGAKEDKRYQATSIDTLLHMIASGAGVTLIPQLATNRHLTGVSYRRFTEPAPAREVVLVTRKNSARRKASDALAKLIRDCIAEQHCEPK